MVPSIVYVPGFMQRASAWEPVATRLAERYPPVLAEHASYELEGRLAEIEAAAPPGSVLCGYSMGGRLCLHAALRAPERYGGLVMLGAGAGVADREERRLADAQLATWMEGRPIAEVVARWEAQPVFASQAPELVEAQRPGRLSFDPADLARLLRAAGQGAMEPVWESLPALQLPVLTLAGELDGRYRKEAVRVARLVPHGESHAIASAGHAAHLEQHVAVAARLQIYLQALSPQ